MRSAARKTERDLARLRRQAKFFDMPEEEATLARVYSGSADGDELTDTLRKDR